MPCGRSSLSEVTFGLASNSSMPHRMTYIVQRKDRFYIVAYDGLDPLTGKERRRWHPVGHDREEAESVAARIDRDRTRRLVARAYPPPGPRRTCRGNARLERARRRGAPPPGESRRWDCNALKWPWRRPTLPADGSPSGLERSWMA